MLTGSDLFPSKEDVLKFDGTLPSNVPMIMGEVKDLLQKMLAINRADRIAIQEIKEHSWCRQDIIDIIEINDY